MRIVLYVWHENIFYTPDVCDAIFSCDQVALRRLLSVRLSVGRSVSLSVCLSHLFHNVPFIVSSWKFQELLPLTKVVSMQKVKVRGQRSKSHRTKKSPILTQIEFFRTVPPVWIYRWLWNDAQNLKHKEGALLFKVIRQISRSQGLKNRWFGSDLGKITWPSAAIKSLRFALLFILLSFVILYSK